MADQIQPIQTHKLVFSIHKFRTIRIYDLACVLLFSNIWHRPGKSGNIVATDESTTWYRSPSITARCHPASCACSSDLLSLPTLVTDDWHAGHRLILQHPEDLGDMGPSQSGILQAVLDWSQPALTGRWCGISSQHIYLELAVSKT